MPVDGGAADVVPLGRVDALAGQVLVGAGHGGEQQAGELVGGRRLSSSSMAPSRCAGRLRRVRAGRRAWPRRARRRAWSWRRRRRPRGRRAPAGGRAQPARDNGSWLQLAALSEQLLVLVARKRTHDHPLPSGCAFSLLIDGREKADMGHRSRRSRRGGVGVSSRGESHPPALSEPYVTVSRHTAPTDRPLVGEARSQWAKSLG